MKRILVLLAVLLPMSWCLAGCGGQGSRGSSPKITPKAESKGEVPPEIQRKMANK
jgi:hypothetical protein